MDIFEAMVKLKLFISLIFLLAIQQVYSSSPLSRKSFSIQANNEIESSFEANDSFPGILGDVPSCRVVISTLVVENECDPGYSKLKDVLSGLNFSVAKTRLKFCISKSSVFTRYSAVYIPIYLQTASFLL